jgi:hypothetical protein
MTQVVELLPNKALSSNPSTAKQTKAKQNKTTAPKKKKKRKKEGEILNMIYSIKISYN